MAAHGRIATLPAVHVKPIYSDPITVRRSDMDDPETMPISSLPRMQGPLSGFTILVVEDSRLASDALRLLCLHSGARIRRAESLDAARRHLSLYQPSAVIIDLGLPDGNGQDLIRDLATARKRIPVILGISGHPGFAELAMKAGANGFIAKPIDSVERFQNAILSCLTRCQAKRVPVTSRHTIHPDPLAYRDDLIQAEKHLSGAMDSDKAHYLAQFLSGIARTARDAGLEAAARRLWIGNARGRPIRCDIDRIRGIVHDRLTGCGPI